MANYFTLNRIHVEHHWQYKNNCVKQRQNKTMFGRRVFLKGIGA